MDTIHIPTAAEIAWITEVGTARRQQAKALGCKDRYDYEPKSEEDALAQDILGAAGEWAFAREIGETWQATMQSWSDPDHIAADGTPWQVKTTDKPHHGLPIHPKYDPSHLYALALVVDGQDWRNGIVIRGWRKSRDIKRLGEERQSGKRSPFRVIPTHRLKWMEDAPGLA